MRDILSKLYRLSTRAKFSRGGKYAERPESRSAERRKYANVVIAGGRGEFAIFDVPHFHPISTGQLRP